MSIVKLDLLAVSTQLMNVGWQIVAGSVGAPGTKWIHPRIERRRFDTYEAALCHNLLVNISKMNKDDVIYPTYSGMLRLLADGWSIDCSFLETSDVFISINDKMLWWKQIYQGGKRFSFLEIESAIQDSDDLDYAFLEYLSETEMCYIDPNSTCFEGESEEKKVKRNSDTVDVVLHRTLSVVDNEKELKTVIAKALLVLIDKDLQAKFWVVKNMVGELREKLVAVEEELEKIESMIGFGTNEKTD